MTKQLTLDEIKNIITPILKDSGVIRSSLFGSVTKGNLKSDSDIDILVEFENGKTLLDLAGLQIKLEESLNTKVDVLTYDSISPFLKESILESQIPLF